MAGLKTKCGPAILLYFLLKKETKSNVLSMGVSPIIFLIK